MSVSPAIALLSAIIALQLYTIVYLHQLSPVCNCGSGNFASSPSHPSSVTDSGRPVGSENGPQNALSRASAPPGLPPKVRPNQQRAPDTPKSTSDLLYELSQTNPGSEPAGGYNAPPKVEVVTQNPTGPVSNNNIQAPPAIHSPLPPTEAPAPVIQSPGGGGALERVQMRVIDFLNRVHPQGIGIVLGIGRSPMALDLLAQWRTSPGLYLCDPFIHIWKGYDDPSNVNDKEHQLIFEDLRNKLQIYEGRHSLVRDFSSSFAVTFKSTGNVPPVSLVWIDNNPDSKAVFRDLSDWLPTVAHNGIMAGPRYSVKSVQAALHSFVDQQGLKLGLFEDGETWFVSRQGMGGGGGRYGEL